VLLFNRELTELIKYLFLKCLVRHFSSIQINQQSKSILLLIVWASEVQASNGPSITGRASGTGHPYETPSGGSGACLC
jgi:hypothetical protein